MDVEKENVTSVDMKKEKVIGSCSLVAFEGTMPILCLPFKAEMNVSSKLILLF